MGLLNIFNFFKKKDRPSITKNELSDNGYADSKSIDGAERHCYKPDEYYTNESYPGHEMSQKVITFQERKKTCIPSERGLYVAEILLLEYCRKGKYPNPKYGYPGFWWFEYGIRDVGHALKSLEQRGFIQMTSARNSLDSLTVTQLKNLLRSVHVPVSGKKSALIERVKERVPDDILTHSSIDCKYQLTELGEQELQDNAYVPYMHSCPYKTTDDGPRNQIFNVWRINQLLGQGDKSDWKKVVDEIEQEIKVKNDKEQQNFMDDLKKIDPKGYKKLKDQDNQLATINRMEKRYEADGDLNALIGFWEKLWNSGGLMFEGVHWHFRLPDLYIKAKRYEDAMAFCDKIKSEKKQYYDKADSYIKRIEKKLATQAAKKVK